MALKKAQEVIELRPVEILTAEVTIVGDTPLIVHNWSVKAKREMLEKQMKTTKTKAREAKNPVEDFIESMYWITPKPAEPTEEAFAEAVRNGARWGVPVTGIKQSAIAGTYRLGALKDMASVRGAFFIEGIQVGTDQLAEVISDTPIIREDMVRVGMGTADIRFRAQYDNWRIPLRIKYNANGRYSLEQIVNMINIGGSSVGICEWRPEKDGQYGMFHVEAVK